MDESNLSYFCVKCYEEMFPYHSLNEAEFANLNSSDKKRSLSDLLMSDDLDHLCDFPNRYITPENFHKQNGTSNDFFVLHINTRSLNKNFKKLVEILIQLGKLPEMIAISETKLQAEFKMQLHGYNFIQNNSNTNAGDVGMFVKETLAFQATTEYQLYTEGCEDLWITGNINNTKKVFDVLHSHPQKDFTNFSKSLEQTLTALNRNKKQYLIRGDVNINLLDYESKSNIKDYVDKLGGSGSGTAYCSTFVHLTQCVN